MHGLNRVGHHTLIIALQTLKHRPPSTLRIDRSQPPHQRRTHPIIQTSLSRERDKVHLKPVLKTQRKDYPQPIAPTSRLMQHLPDQPHKPSRVVVEQPPSREP